MKVAFTPFHLLIGAAIIAAIVYIWSRGVGGAAESASKSAVKVVGGLVSGTTKGISEVFGIPDTDPAQCERDKAAGNWWDATFSCSVPNLFKNIWNPTPATSPPVYGEKANPSVITLDSWRAINFPVKDSLF